MYVFIVPLMVLFLFWWSGYFDSEEKRTNKKICKFVKLSEEKKRASLMKILRTCLYQEQYSTLEKLASHNNKPTILDFFLEAKFNGKIAYMVDGAIKQKMSVQDYFVKTMEDFSASLMHDEGISHGAGHLPS